MNNQFQLRFRVICAAASAACFATLPLISSIAYADGVSPITLLFLPFAMADVCLSELAIACHERFPGGRNCLILIALGSISLVLQSFCCLSNPTLIPARLATILLCLYSAFVVCLLLLKGQPIARAKLSALTLSLVGCYLVSKPIVAQDGSRVMGGTVLAVGVYGVLAESVLWVEESIPVVAVLSAAVAVVYAVMDAVSRFPCP